MSTSCSTRADQRIIAYTDGSCSKRKGGWGAIILLPDKEIHLSGHDSDTTNNRMELIAIIEALREMSTPRVGGDAFLIYSDSQLCINCAQRLWKRNKNLDLWKEYDSLAKNKDIKFVWVRGHDGNEYNEKVDRLANTARQSIRG